MINYTPFGHSDWQTIVADIKTFGSAGKKTAVVSTINGDANVPFYKELGNQGISAEDIPVVAFSVGEEELAGHRHQAAGRPPRRLELLPEHRHPENAEFIKQVEGLHQERRSASPTTRWKRTYIGFNMWVKAVEKAGTTDLDKVIDAHDRHRVPNLTGGSRDAAEPPHHQAGADRRGRRDGQFDVVWKTAGLVPGDAWSDFLPGSKDLIADWVDPEVRQLQHQDQASAAASKVRLIAKALERRRRARSPPPSL